MSESIYTDEQLAFQLLHRRAVSTVRAIHPNSMEFRLVRHRGVPVGWTFSTEQYPAGTFGWVTTQVRVGPAVHELRLYARNALKKQI